MANAPAPTPPAAAPPPPAEASAYHYIVIRKELSGGAALAHVAHASGESAAVHSLLKAAAVLVEAFRNARPISFGELEGILISEELRAHADPMALFEKCQLPGDTRAVILGATKDQMAELLDGLDRAHVPHKAIIETDGPLAGMITSVGLVTENRAALKPLLGELKPFKLG
jgi:hypothetical protein